MKKLILFTALLIGLSCNSCMNESDMLESDPIKEYEEVILALGYSPDEAVQEKIGIIVEGDIGLDYPYLKDLKKQLEDKEGLEKHRKLLSCVPYSFSLVDKIYLYDVNDEMDDYPDWRDACNAAMSEYFSAHSYINFIRSGINKGVTSGPNVVDVEFVDYPSSSWNGVVTGFDSSCNSLPSRLLINIAHSVPGAGRKKGVWMHEMGHVLGFHHTDNTGATLISGTCTSDSLSIMNAGIWNYPEWEFTTCDLDALDILYD